MQETKRNSKSRTIMDSRDFRKRKNVCGYFPQYGAIFMSNRSTLQECFERSLFGLPDAHSDFVSKVKEGMILFLFEFEEKKLHGVFKAISDGGMNIVPDAYASSGRQFPAQVKFNIIWQCDPLYEDEFSDALQDNYYSTYKFNFGLSKDQVESLIWLFNSQKHEVPHTLHYNKRKEREWHFQSIEGGQMEGRFSDIQISEMKLKMNHDISVIAEPEVERLSSSPDSCRKCESIPFYDDAYDPENPGFHRSVGFGAHRVAGHESHELPTLQKKKGNLHNSAEDTEDFIPLCPSDNSDAEEVGEFYSCECSKEKQIDIFLDSIVSSIPIPQLPLSNERYNPMKKKGLSFAYPDRSPCCKLDGSSAAHLLSDASDLQSKDGINNSDSLPVKGMYSDNHKQRTSVFSRLNFSSKSVASKKGNDASGKKSVNDLSRAKKKQRYVYENMEKVTRQKHGIANWSTMCSRRTNVWLRLAGGSDAVTSEVHCMTGMEEGTGELKKG